MSIEWLIATREPAAILTEGTFIHKYPEPVTQPLAIQFGQDDGAVIEGTATDLLAMLERARQLVLNQRACMHFKYR
jgi:hypothetical protein